MKITQNVIHKFAGRSVGLAITLGFGLLSGLAVAGDYEIVDLGANVAPKDINNGGVVAGAMNTDQYPNSAFYGTPGAFTNIDSAATSANAINDEGKVAGSTLTGAFVLDGNNYGSWDEHSAFGISEIGDVSGNKAGKNPYRETSTPYNPAVLEGNKWTVMDIAQVYPRGTRPGVYADIYTLMDVNDNGYTVGSRRRYGLVGSSAILITPPYGDVRDGADVIYLPTTSGGAANAINELNVIVGTSGNDSRSGTYSSAFIYDAGTVQYLAPLPGGLRSGGYDINDFDQVVGFSESSDGNRAVMWDAASGAIVDLNSPAVAASGWVLSSATAINNAGDIVGTGLLNGQSHGFLLTTAQVPPPPPANEPPVAVASADNATPTTRTTVQFSSAGSSEDVVSFSWDFGDGSSSSAANPGHKYKKEGNYVAVLTVTDDGGLTGTDSVDIMVSKVGRK